MMVMMVQQITTPVTKIHGFQYVSYRSVFCDTKVGLGRQVHEVQHAQAAAVKLECMHFIVTIVAIRPTSPSTCITSTVK
jgi:hypothetical protein